MTPPADIETDRLILRVLPVEALRETVKGNLDAVAKLVGCRFSEHWAEVARLAEMRLEQLETDLGYLPWSIRTVILLETNDAVGYANFHAGPAPHAVFQEAPNMAEIGYTIFEPWQRRGFARETLSALLRFARENGADQAVLSIAPDNEASLALAKRFGFVKIGSQMDEVDGPEDVYVLPFETSFGSNPQKT